MAYLRSYHTQKGIKYLIREGSKDIANLGYCTRREAEKSFKQVSQEIARQKLNRKFHLRDDKLLFSDYLDIYIDNYLGRKAPETRISELKAIAKFKNLFGHIPLAELQKTDIEQYINWRLAYKKKNGDPVSPKSIEVELGYLKLILNKAVDDAYLNVSPYKPSIKAPKIDKPLPRFLTVQECQTLLDTCSAHLRSILLLDVLTGLRKGELLRLKFSEIDFDRKVIAVVSEPNRHTKNRRSRLIDLHPTALEELRFLTTNWPHPSLNKYLPRQKHQIEYVFCHEDGNPFKEIKRSFGRAKRIAGLEGIKFHDLRKTFVSWLAQTGTHPKVAMMLAGHSDVKITMDVYTGISRDEMKQAINSLPSFDSSKKLRVISG